MDKKQNAFATLRILHLAMIIGIIVFGGVAFYVTRDKPLASAEENLNRILQFVAIILSLGGLVIGYKRFTRKIMGIRSSNNQGIQRMEEYKKAAVGWWALIEMPSMFAIVCFMLIGNYAFLALAGFHLLILLLFSPRKDNIILLLNLSSEEVRELEDAK